MTVATVIGHVLLKIWNFGPLLKPIRAQHFEGRVDIVLAAVKDRANVILVGLNSALRICTGYPLGVAVAGIYKPLSHIHSNSDAIAISRPTLELRQVSFC